MLIRFMFLLLLLVFVAPSAWSQSEEDMKLLVDVIQKATAIHAYVDLCLERAPATDDDNQQAYDAWKERNQWETVRYIGIGTKCTSKRSDEPGQCRDGG